MTTAIRREVAQAFESRLRHSRYAETPATNSATEITEAFIMWTYIHGSRGVRNAATGSVIAATVAPFRSTSSNPRGVCIQALTTRIQNPESHAPRPTSADDST